MTRKIFNPTPSLLGMRSNPLALPVFVRPSANRAAARARATHSPFDDFWTPNLLDRLHAPLRSYRD